MDPGRVVTESSSGAGTGSGTRPAKGKRTVVSKYTRHACAQCRKAKAKCEGGKPVCERCQKTGHECNWSLEDARRPLTRAHEQALKHKNALLQAEVDRLTHEVEALRLRVSTAPTPSISGVTNVPNPGLKHPASAQVQVDTTSSAQHSSALSASDSPSTGIDIGARAGAAGLPGLPPTPTPASAPISTPTSTPTSAEALDQGTGTSNSYCQHQTSPPPPPVPVGTDRTSGDHPQRWAILPVEDIASDAQEDEDTHIGFDSDNEGDDERLGRAAHGKTQEGFECDVESAYGSSEGSDEDSDSCSDEDSDSDTDSDADVDKALVAPSKTLFTEQDDLHHFGLTSVFRLRRPASHRTVRPGSRSKHALRQSHIQQPNTLSSEGAAPASEYDSVSSTQGVPNPSQSPNNAEALGGHRSLRSFLSSSSANEGGPSDAPTSMHANEDTTVNAYSNIPAPAPVPAHLTLPSPTGIYNIDGGAFSDTAAFQRFNKRNRKGKRALLLPGGPGPHSGSDIGMTTPYTRTRTRARTRARPRPRVRVRVPSPVRTQRHVLLVGDADIPAQDKGVDNGNSGSTGKVWKGCDCQSECWSRWLPKGVPFSRKEHDILLDRVFLFFTSWCMRLIPEYFLRDMYTFLHTPSQPSLPRAPTTPSSLPQPRLAHYSPFLHNALLAVSTAFSSSPHLRSPSTRNLFATEAKSYLEEELSRPNISTVCALGLLASYHSGQGQQTLGFTYFGMSARIAQALGLFADCTMLMRSGRLGVRQVFDRTWCFHMAAAQDTCWSMYVGRECGIPLPSSSAAAASASAKKKSQGREAAREEEPKNNDMDGQLKRQNKPKAFSMDDPFSLGIISEEGEIGESLDRMTWRTRGRRPNERTQEDEEESIPQCKTFTTLQWSCQLMKIGRSIMDLMNRLASFDNATEIKLLVTDIDIQLDAWRQDLPPELKLTPTNEMTALPHKLMVHAAFWWQHILLHRPFYQRHRSKSGDSVFSVTRCNVAAREILSVLRLWRKIYGTVRYCPITLVQTIFAAGTIYILQAMQASSGRRPATQTQASALNNLEELLGYLRECAESWEAAVRIADIFERILGEQRRGMEKANALRGAGGAEGGAGGKSRKKRRRLEALRENEVAVHAARSALVNHHNSSSALSDTPANANDSGYGGESSLNPPPASINANTDNTDPSQFAIVSDDSQHQHQYQTTLLSPSISITTHTGEDISPIFASPSPIVDAAFSFGNTSDTQTAALPHLPGAHIPIYPTGYLSDESSYMSDTPYTGMSMDDIGFDDWTSFSALVTSASAFLSNSTSTNSQATTTFDNNDNSNNNNNDNNAEFHNNSSNDLLLFNPEVNMDAVMPGMGLMFDPATSLTLPLSGLTFDPGSVVGERSDTAGSYPNQQQQQQQTGFAGTYLTGMDGMDRMDRMDGIDGVDTYALSAPSDVEGLPGGYATDIHDMDMGEEDDRSLYELLAALNTHHHHHV